MKRFTIFINGDDSGLTVTEVNKERALMKLVSFVEVALTATLQGGAPLTIEPESVRCKLCPLPIYGKMELCAAHYHQQGNVKRPCSVKRCKSGHYAKGLCRQHYLKQWARAGTFRGCK